MKINLLTIRTAQAAGRRRRGVITFAPESVLGPENSPDSLRAAKVVQFPTAESTESGATKTDNRVSIHAEATPDSRRGRSMSRRSGQNGYIERKGNWYHVRFWQDKGPRRVHKSIRLCSVNGPGSLTKPERQRRAREIIAESGADSPECLARAEAIRVGLTFRHQAERWIEHIRQRKRRPVKLATWHGYRHLLDRWILPVLGGLLLCDVGNSTVKTLVAKMVESGMSPETIRHVVKVVKLVVASYVDENGEPILKRAWNPDYMEMPIVDKRSQRRPTFTAEETTRIIAGAKGRYLALLAIAAGTGARIAEILGLEVGKHISVDCSTLTIGQSVWRHGEIQTPKTPSGYREIDLHPSLAAVLRDHIGDRKNGFLFVTENGRPLSQRNALRALHSILKSAGLEKRGFHAFRRFRQTWLRKNRAPEDIIRYWLGWSSKSIADGYSKLQDDVAFRKGVAESVGLGFEIPSTAPDDVPNRTLSEVVSEVA